MPARRPHLLASTLLAAAVLPAQNLVPNGDFAAGQAGWTLSQWNETRGSTGVAPGFVDGSTSSNALYADFVTLQPVMSATWTSAPLPLPAGTLPVGLRAMWNKAGTTPIPYPSANRVDVLVRNAAGTVVFTTSLGVPGQTGYQERATLSATVEIAAAGLHTVELVLRHSNLAGMPFSTWVDDVVVGQAVALPFGQGCPGSGGIVPKVACVNVPRRGSTDCRIELQRARVPSTAVLALDLTCQQAGGMPLPLPLGGGCSLLVGTTALATRVPTGTSGFGTAQVPLPIPMLPGLAGTQLFAQWGVFDVAAPNAYGLVTSGGLQITIQ